MNKKQAEEIRDTMNNYMCEIEATAFAIELLMPEKVIEKDIQDNYVNEGVFLRERAVNELPIKYAVEKWVVMKRLDMMGYCIN